MDNWKCMCDDCGWHGENADLLTAASPFDESEVIHGCPRCKSINQFTRCCDEAIESLLAIEHKEPAQ